MAREELQRFALDMERKLQANDHKPGWSHDALWSLLRRLRQETDELSSAIDSGSPQRIIDEAADVANFAMMIADNTRRLLSAWRPASERSAVAIGCAFPGCFGIAEVIPAGQSIPAGSIGRTNLFCPEHRADMDDDVFGDYDDDDSEEGGGDGA